jgi:hypothetical protein
MNDNLLLKRLFIAISGIVLILVSIYSYRITEQRQTVLENGTLVKAVVSEVFIGRRNSKDINVKINNKEYDAGDAIREYDNVKVGDSIEVYYIDNIEYAAPKNRVIYSYSGYFAIELITFILAILIVIISPFLKTDSRKITIENFNWIDTKLKDTKNAVRRSL